MGSSLVQGSSPEAFKRFVELLGRIVFLATLRRAYIKLRWAEAEEVLYCLTCLLTDLLTYCLTDLLSYLLISTLFFLSLLAFRQCLQNRKALRSSRK